MYELHSLIRENSGLVVSDGSLRTVDIIVRLYDFMVVSDINDELRSKILSFIIIENSNYEKGSSLEVESYYDRLHLPEHKEYEATEFLNDEVYPYLNSLSPNGYYFGSNEGSSSCIGWFETTEVN